MRHKKKILSLLLVFVVFGVFLTTHDVFAQDPNPAVRIVNPLQFESLSAFVKAMVKVARDIGMLVAVFSIVYAGFLKVTALGDEEKLKKANKAFLWAVMGTAVLLGAWLIAFSIENTVKQIEQESRSGPSSWYTVDKTWIS